MQEQRRKTNVSGGVVAAVLLMSLAIGVIVVLGVGLLLSGLVLNGAGIQIIEYGVPAGLFLGALLGGVFACAKLKRAPLLWGVCVGAALTLVCCLAAVAVYDAANWMTLLRRGAAALAGGAAAGVLSALTRK